MPTPRRSTHTPSTSDTTFDKEDVTDIAKPLWNSAPNELPPFLIKLGEWLLQDADYESLITNGTVLSRNQVCCVNQNHIDRVSRDLIAAGKPDKPFDYNTFETFAADAFVPPSRYIENPEVIRSAEKLLLDSICSTIIDSSTRKSLRLLKTGTAALVHVHVHPTCTCTCCEMCA